MAARNNAGGKAASTTEAGFKHVIIGSALYLRLGTSSNSQAIILPPFRSRPFDLMMKIKKN